MKIFGVLILSFFFSLSSIASEARCTNYTGNDSLTIKAKKLRRLYLLATNSSNAKMYQRQFFNEFPNTFREFDQLYGYNDKTSKGAILYKDAEKHLLGLFNNLKSINDTLYYRKIVNIAIGGTWEADAVNFFQYGLINRMESKPGLIVFFLRRMNEKKVKSFWHFYFDEPHPQKDIPDALKRIKALNKNIYRLMVKAHKESLMLKE